jgi:MoaA/NifB/PqqE/SkfB family radical SAM enzyme
MQSDGGESEEAIWDRFPKEDRQVINFTLTCNLACAHCIVESSPYRTERLSMEEVRTALSTGWSNGKRHVTFSGGEVFLFADEVCEAIAFARGLGYVVDVESNGFWARSEGIARTKLAPFAAAGISGLALSSDAYHVKYFPVERTIHAARAARSFGLLTEINFCASSQLDVDAAIMKALTDAGESFLRNELLDRGRGKTLSHVVVSRGVAELPDCDSLTTTVHATGDVYACCELDTSSDAMRRTPVFLGSLREGTYSVATQLEREAVVGAFYDPDSPIYFRKLVAEHEQFRELAAGQYHSICDFCMKALGDPARVAVLRELMARGDSQGGA